MYVAVASNMVAHDMCESLVFESNRSGLGKTATAALGICCHADTAQLVIPLASSAPLWEGRPFRRCHAAVHHLLELARIEKQLGGGCIRHRRRRHEIDAAGCVGAHAELTCRGIDEALAHICSLGPPSAAIGANTHRVCAHALDGDVERPNRIET